MSQAYYSNCVADHTSRSPEHKVIIIDPNRQTPSLWHIIGSLSSSISWWQQHFILFIAAWIMSALHHIKCFVRRAKWTLVSNTPTHPLTPRVLVCGYDVCTWMRACLCLMGSKCVYVCVCVCVCACVWKTLSICLSLCLNVRNMLS